MKKRSEGVRRIILLITGFLLLFWGMVVYGILSGVGFAHISPWEFFCLLVIAPVVCYLVPNLTAKLIYWIVDGFRTDKKET